MLRSIRCTAMLAAALCSAHAAGQDGEDREDDEAFDRTPQSCILTTRIDRTEVVDDNTILFHMRGRDPAYVNYLPRGCPNLARENSFTYQLRSRRLCDVTTITVLEDAGFRPGFTCRLGEFHPVTEAEVEEIRRVAAGESSGDAVDIEQVEVPDDAADEDARSDDVSDREDDD